MNTFSLSDTHCHLYLDHFEKDLERVLERAIEQGVRNIYLPAIDWNSLNQMDKLKHPKITFHRMAGIHPCSVHENWPYEEKRLFDLAESELYVAVGETGLDYYWSRDNIEQQKESLKRHCRVAKAVGKPVVLHNRESTTDLLDLIESEQDGNLTGVWHCFTGTPDEGRRAIDLGLKLGIGGVLTFKNAGVDKSIAELPSEQMILETDAPYLAPSPKRGKRNEPSYVSHTAKKFAEIFQIDIDQVARMTTRTAESLFAVKSQAG